MSRWTLVFVLVATPGVAFLGLLAEWTAYGPNGYAGPNVDATYPWILDLLTGYVFLASGVAATIRRPDSLIGVVFVLTAAAWFVGTLVEPARFVGTALAPSLVFLYRGPLVHAIVAFPSGRPASGLEWLAILAGYAASLLAPLWFHPAIGLTLAGLLTAVTAISYRRATAGGRSARLDALEMALLLLIASATLTVGRQIGLVYPLSDALTIAFHVVLMAVPLRLTARLLRSGRPELTDLVVEMTGDTGTSLEGELSRLLRDPSLRILIWDARREAYVRDEELLPASSIAPEDRARTLVALDSDPLAVILHAHGTLDEPDVREAVVDAVRLAVTNTKLRAQVRAQVAELEASRRRLVDAGDVEGERLGARLRDGPMRHLESISTHLAVAAGITAGTGALADTIDRARHRLGPLRDDLGDLTLGLDPRGLTRGGLGPALTELARDCPVPVTLRCEIGTVPPELATAAYLVSAEALANATRHSGATSIRIEAGSTASELQLTVADDGAGGATFGSGHGLRNVADRVAALGGSLSVVSPRSQGTRLTVSLPLPVDIHSDPVLKPRVNTNATPLAGT